MVNPIEVLVCVCVCLPTCLLVELLIYRWLAKRRIMNNNSILAEQIKTVKNLCDISVILMNTGKYELLPTIFELMLIEAQTIVDEQCVVGGIKNGK